MSDGKRRPGRPGRSEEPRIAPEEDEDATRDIPLFTRPEETRMGPVEPRFEETRMGPVESFSHDEDLPPLEPPALETRMGPVPDARPAWAGRSRSAARSARTEPPAPVMPPKPPRPRGGPEKRASPPKASASPASVGVVRLSPLEPLGAKVVAAEEAPALRTMFANHSALLAEQLRDALSTKMYGRGPHRVLRIDEPEGPSTAGGKLARQAISLVPRKGAGTSLTCGWVDVSKREAQLRNFEAVAKRYELHHGEPLEMQAEEYERFLTDVEAVLTQAVIKVRVIVPEEAGAVRVASPSASAKGVPPVWAGLLAVLAFVLGLLAGRMGSGG
ncbi:hypothetical protein [Myxococcus virescens]|uniref:Uncharacterized protein n=1 Tax=Myxococcus virescens TaxID=83456 RepID=A0A511HIP5_9BACT|nr:hypothetical protein [Myxococcus virescens]GEL73447.1 hypothetical protein MVI01_52310 [Myxococcus virescens]SDE89666.1 hypothetical protein SAMN04488504_11491 [Myxococcus virescens]